MRDIRVASILFSIGLPVWAAGVLLSITAMVPLTLYIARLINTISYLTLTPATVLAELGSLIQLAGFIYLRKFMNALSADGFLRAVNTMISIGLLTGLLASAVLVLLPLSPLLFAVGYVGLGGFFLRLAKQCGDPVFYGVATIFPLSISTFYTLSVAGWVILLSVSLGNYRRIR
ncbi:hypothetical protein ACSU1N_01200 [Thermogladius sp. 4427co]|uniref:hypothetical protein n=1 Tax=Thermogladius sp. 4427co TaxID=3450718 RepID=UPI003F78EF2F